MIRFGIRQSFDRIEQIEDRYAKHPNNVNKDKAMQEEALKNMGRQCDIGIFIRVSRSDVKRSGITKRKWVSG